MKRILINATQTEELRVAIVDVNTQQLLDLLVERQSYKTKTGNIYLGKITAIEPSLDAAFVNFGSERHGFLPFKEISPTYFNHDPNKSERASIKDTIREGQSVMVQVEKEERGNKGAALTTFISLAGSYLVLMPNNPRAGGISRRVEGEDRDELRDILGSLPIPEGMGLIVRTAGVGKAHGELQWDLNTLLKQWEAIQKATTERNPPFLIHQEGDVLIRAIRDHLRQDVAEILVDDSSVFERIKTHLDQIRPDFVHCLKLYNSTIPIFSRYQIEHQIEAAHDREVRLPSGGSIVIGHTEALVAIDVNSGQATKGKDIEQTALEINKEAARIIACQLRLRDIGGLIVIDFIDMPSIRHRREVENELRNALKLDKARTQIGTISPRFGLLEMSRQRLRHSLGEATRIICPRCDGWGSIRSVESLALSILRMIEEDAIRPGTTSIQAQLPVDLATFVMNEKRDLIATIEKNQNIQIVIIPNPRLEAPHYRIKRITEGEAAGSGKMSPSYRLMDTSEPEAAYKKSSTATREETPAVQSIFTNAHSHSTTLKKPTTSIVKRLLSSLFGGVENETTNSTASSSATITPASQTAGMRQPPATAERHQRGHERQHQHRRPTQSKHIKTAKGPVAKEEDTTKMQQQSRSRRGARGGTRRRSGHSHQNDNTAQQRPAGGRNRQVQPRPVTPVETSATPPSPDHLPPFPTDLEEYYQKSAGFTATKSSSSSTDGKTDKKPRATTTSPQTPRHTAESTKELFIEKSWTPHKIAPANPTIAKDATPSLAITSTVTSTTPRVAEKPVKAESGNQDKPAPVSTAAVMESAKEKDQDGSGE